MSNSQVVEATIRTRGEDFAVVFEAAQLRLLTPDQSAQWEVMVMMSYEGVTLDVLEHLHLRFNGEPTLRPAQHGSEIEDGSGNIRGFGFGVSGDGLVESIEAVWVEDGEQSLGMLPIRFADSDVANTASIREPRRATHDADAGSVGHGHDAPMFGLTVRVHRIALIVATFSGFFGAAILGGQLWGGFGGVICAGFGALLMGELFHRLIPAICPDCGHRADCLLSSRDVIVEHKPHSATVIRYECRACGFELPRRVTTRASLAAFASSAIRAARFAKGFFTLVGGSFVLITAIIAVLGLARGDFETAALAFGAMLIVLVWRQL